MWTVIVRDAQGQVVAQHEWAQGSLTVGRDQTSTIVLPSKLASRKHARLDLLNGVPVVVDQGSSNGTLVNGARITVPTRLDDASRLQIGEFQISVQKQAEEDDGEKTVMMRPSQMAPPPPPRPQAAPPPPPPRPAPPPPPPKPAAPPPRAPEPVVAAPAMPEVRFPSTPASPNPYRPEDANSVTSQFERHLQSVRSHREESQATTLTRGAKLEQEWAKLVVQMKALQARLTTDKRVQSFSISRDQKEIALKITDPHEKRGYRYFLLSRDHPEGKFPGVHAVWLREFGRDDASFEEPQKAAEELLLRVAGTLA
jgi:predicted component of type VI protein secretion system